VKKSTILDAVFDDLNLEEKKNFADEDHSGVQEELTVKLEETHKELLRKASECLESARIAYRTAIKKAKKDAALLVSKKNKEFVVLERSLRKRLREGYKRGMCDGYEEGYDLGRKIGEEEKKQELDETLVELKEIINRLNQSKAEMLERYEEDLVDLAFNIAQKVTKSIVEKNDEIYVNIAKSVLDGFGELEWVLLTVPSVGAKEKIALDKRLLGTVSGFKNVRISVNDEEEEGGLLIDTPLEFVDAGVETQIRNVRNKMKALLGP
jgi:flagellar assembly protein FliH